MANNVIMFYSEFTDRNLQNLSADLCVYSNAIINCTVSLTSTLDYSTFAPYDSVECVLINRPNVHSNTEYEYNYYSFMRVGTNPALTSSGANSTNTTAIAAGPIFYISEVADIGGGMRKIRGVSALALLDTEHYMGGYWASDNKGNVVNEMFYLMQNWHQQITNPAFNNMFCENLSGSNVNNIVGILNANTNRNALGQIFIAYGWHVGYNRNVISNATLRISRNPSNFCTYTVPTNRIYVGNNLSDRAQSAGYRVNVTGHDYSSTTGCTNAIVLNNSTTSTITSCTFSFTCAPVLPETLEALIGTADIYQTYRTIDGDDHYTLMIQKRNRWVPLYSVYSCDYSYGRNFGFLINTKNVYQGATVTNSSKINGYNMLQYFSNVSPCEITMCNLMSYPFPWEANLSSCVSWTVYTTGSTGNPFCGSAVIRNNNGGCLSNQLVFRANTLNTSVIYVIASGGGGLTITDYNISDIGIISANTSGQSAQNVLNRVSNFATAGTTEKLSFPWNGARPGDILSVASNRNGLITDMTITLSNIPKATANVRIGYNGR